MSKEQIEDSYQFKVTKRLIKKEFPFITDMELTYDWDKYKSVIFVDLTFSPTELMKLINIPDTKESRRYLRVFTSASPYLSMYFPSNMEQTEQIRKIASDIEKFMERIHNSPSIPLDMKLPTKLRVSGWKPEEEIDNTK